MKNLKNTAAAFGLMATLAFGAVSANAGILISDKNGASPCGSVRGSLMTSLTGIFVAGLPMLDGIIITGRSGILISDRDGIIITGKDAKGGCTSGKDGIIITGRSGILISD